MSSRTRIQDVLGECFMTGVAGHELDNETGQFLDSARIGGVIYFAHNYSSPEQISKFSASLQPTNPAQPLRFLAVDHEGGRVQRFKSAFTRIPEAMDLAEKLTPKQIFEVSELIAKELAAVGVNLNFAPVADIHSNPKNPVIGRRSFGHDEATVSKLVSAFVRGHLTAGVHPCSKHFPGHGDTTVDSHFALPEVKTTIETLKEREFRPFLKAIKSGCRFIMSAHVLNRNLDAIVPATLSKRTMSEILRDELRYTGVIVSDDMEMQAITDNFGAEKAPVMALLAGVDMLIYRSESACRRGYQAVLKEIPGNTELQDRIWESANRILQVKRETLRPYQARTAQDLGAVVGTEDSANFLRSMGFAV